MHPLGICDLDKYSDTDKTIWVTTLELSLQEAEERLTQKEPSVVLFGRAVVGCGIVQYTSVIIQDSAVDWDLQKDVKNNGQFNIAEPLLYTWEAAWKYWNSQRPLYMLFIYPQNKVVS